MPNPVLHIAAILVSSLLFGGMTLFSFGFAALLFSALPAAKARTVIRQAFPHFYLFVIGTAAVAAALLVPVDAVSAMALGLVALTTVPTRQVLMRAINAATDAGDQAKFKRLHGLSVAITLAHIAAAGWVMARFVT